MAQNWADEWSLRGAPEMFRRELFDAYLDAAVADDELPLEVPRLDIHLLLGNLAMTVMRGLEDGERDLRHYRLMLHRFGGIHFGSSIAPAGA